MNYNDQILEAKTFNFFKQLMYNIALSVCIILLGALIAVYGFKYQLYEVLSNSQYPYFKKGDMVVVKAQDEYNVGDIIKFDQSGAPVSHRLVGIFTEKTSGKTYYVCHGDNNGASNPALGKKIISWEEEVAYISSLINEDTTVKSLDSKAHDLQFVQYDQISGKVVTKLNNYGTYIKTIKNHAGLFITIIAGIWCFSTVIQNELDMKRARRLM